MTTFTPPPTDLRLVVGYDGSPPAQRALNAAVNPLQGRTGRIEAVYVSHVQHGRAVGRCRHRGLEADFDEIEQELQHDRGT